MGLYDRDYTRDVAPGFHFGGGTRTVTTTLVLVTVAVYLLQLFSANDRAGEAGWITNSLALYSDSWKYPWLWFRFLTYGFLHDTSSLQHILFNMFGFWMFGREVERRYGRNEFLAIYLAMIIFAGVAWMAADNLGGGGPLRTSLVGASGGVVGVLILFALNFPRQTILLMGVIPMPAWVLAVIIVMIDLSGAFGRGDTNVAYVAHLGGAAFALAYFRSGTSLARWIPGKFSGDIFKRRPKLRVHRPDESTQDNLSGQVDEILRKIQQEGQDSLSRRERRILEKASREFQRRRD